MIYNVNGGGVKRLAIVRQKKLSSILLLSKLIFKLLAELKDLN